METQKISWFKYHLYNWRGKKVFEEHVDQFRRSNWIKWCLKIILSSHGEQRGWKMDQKHTSLILGNKYFCTVRNSVQNGALNTSSERTRFIKSGLI